ncbi:MAG: hypothetical protein Unbinned3891contig1000_73 [Prokaryotic dsDNA virus sp.]|nr:MAG: hypothetical protein Unbinned3891contig1000_73 [Prokaryotic dsDNA virus sp.]|tara:strand:- start:50292 stop:50837 length:546 start_codon:yes stop_codon:yes gene_type:complete
MNAEEWFDSLVAPVLVVGNGVLSRRVPDRDYQSVIRINNYWMGGRSGSKITHWCASGYKNVQNMRDCDVCLIPWSVEQNWDPDLRWDLGFGDREDVQAIHMNSNRHVDTWFPEARIVQRLYPSTGFCLLAALRQRNIEKHVIGFDGFATGHESNPEHMHEHGRTKRREWKLLNDVLVERFL